MNEKVVNIKDLKYGWKNDDRYVFIGRGSKWGNPFVLGRDGNRDEVCEKYKVYMVKKGLNKEVGELRDKILVCFCKPLRCHGDILLEELQKSV